MANRQGATHPRPPLRRPITTEIEAATGAEAPEEDEPESGPLRRCIVTRERLPKERMIRFVIGPDRQVVPDLTARLPGRGIWLSASADVIGSVSAGDEGRQKERQTGGSADRHLARAFARAARGPVSLPPDLSGLLQAALVRRISEILGLTRRAGQAIAGFEKAREVLRLGQTRLVVQASDGSEAERKRFLSGFGPELTVIDPLPGEALGRIFGRDHVVHVAVAPGKLAESLALEAGRLAGLRNGPARAMGSARATGRETALLNDETGTNG
jgi:ribosomal protein L30E